MKNFKRYVYYCLALVTMFLSIFFVYDSINSTPPPQNAAITYWSNDYSSGFSGGSGTSSNPYLISTPQQLSYMFNAYTGASSVSSGKYFKLIADINLAGKIWDYHRNTTKDFAGTFDGGGFAISNLKNDALCYGGLFGWNFGTIKNLKLISPNIISRHACSLAYYNSSGLIENIMVINGNINSMSSSYASGLVFYNSSGTIKNCYVQATVSAQDPNINYTSFYSGYSRYYVSHWNWDHAGPANVFTGTQDLYWSVGLRKEIIKKYDATNDKLEVYGIAKSGTISNCLFIGSIKKFNFDSERTAYYYQNDISTSHVYSCKGNAYDGQNGSRKPSSPSIGSVYSDGSCHKTESGDVSTSGTTFDKYSYDYPKTIYGYPISEATSIDCYYYNNYSNGTGTYGSESQLKSWSYVSSLGSEWAIDPKINNGYPFPKYFYWQEQV